MILLPVCRLKASTMLDIPDDLPSYLAPLDGRVEFLIDQSDDGHVIASDQIEPVVNFFAVLWVVGWPNDALNCL